MEKTPAQAFAEKFNVCLDEAMAVHTGRNKDGTLTEAARKYIANLNRYCAEKGITDTTELAIAPNKGKQ